MNRIWHTIHSVTFFEKGRVGEMRFFDFESTIKHFIHQSINKNKSKRR